MGEATQPRPQVLNQMLDASPAKKEKAHWPISLFWAVRIKFVEKLIR
ncbi:MAG: hypothetical protein QG605_178 [Euryarchaeota archaeon]|jgi:hypothetical protein|nr:hypothetical protein [Euryarchaeota archaeon]